MKRLNSDFRNAKVGDKVYHVNGSVRTIVKINYNDDYPIVDNEMCRYTNGGKYYKGDSLPEIYTHPVRIIHADDMPVNPRIAEIEREIQRLQNERETLKEVSK